MTDTLQSRLARLREERAKAAANPMFCPDYSDALSVIDALKTQNAQHFANSNRLMELADCLADAAADLDLSGFLKELLEEYWNFEASVSAF